MINYTEEQTKELVELYLAAEDKESIIAILAERFGKPNKSIIGKLSKENVYQKKVYKTKQGELPVTKKEIIMGLSKLIDADAEMLQGLEKAPKLDLKYLVEKITNALSKV
jgi:hypothetical protein